MSDEIAATAPVAEVAPVTTAEPAAASTPAPTLEDTLAESLREIRAREPVHGPDGKFQPKVVAADAAPEGTKVPGSPQAAPTPDPAKPVIEAPQSLPADVKAKWDTFPPEAQQWLANREKEIHQKFTTDGERLKSLGAYEEVLSPYQERLKQVGAPPTEYIRRLAAADKLLADDPRAGILEVARMYGINLGQLQPGAQPDPNSALTREISELKSQLESLKTDSERAKISAAQQIINDAKKDMPHYDAVEPLMVKLYEPGMELKALYSMAVKAHPEVSAKIEAEAKAAADKKAADEAKEKAAKDAKVAPFAKRPGSAPAAKGAGSIWDTLKETHAEIRARG